MNTLVKHGYFLAQELIATGPEVTWRRVGNEGWVFASADEARPYFEYFNGKVDGVDFVPFEYQDADVPAVVEVARLAQDYSIDLWLGPRLYKQVDNLPTPPAKYVSWWMNESGRLSPAMRDVKRRPDVDRLNPEAMKWFMEVYYDKFLRHFEGGLLHGLFWPEEHLGANLSAPDHHAAHYWNLPAYSDASLEQWRDYCRRNQVVDPEGRLVDKFPLHRPEMAAQGKGKTAYYPGFGVTVTPYGSRYVEQPRCTGVWEHWYTYLRQTYLRNFIIPLSRQMHDLNKKNPRWRGVVYFGSTPWMLPYECFTDPLASSRGHAQASANGYQYACDLEGMARSPEIDYIIHEFRGPVGDRMSYLHELFLELVGKEKRDRHGLLVHGNDGGVPLCPREEVARWSFIKQYQPRLISLYPLSVFYPPHPVYDKTADAAFWRRLKAYQETHDPFAGES